MQWFILSRDMHIRAVASTEVPDTISIDDSGNGQVISLENNLAIGTYGFEADANHKDSKYIKEGNYIAFRDKYGKDRLYTMISVEEGSDDRLSVHAEDIGMDFLNETSEPWDYPAKTIEDTLYWTRFDSGWEFGYNEVYDRRRASKYEGGYDTTALTRIGDVCGLFDCEADFTIKIQNGQVLDKKINFYHQLGSYQSTQRFYNDINLVSLYRKGTIENTYTAIKPFGKDNLTIAGIEYDDGTYFSPKDSEYLCSRKGDAQWSRMKAYYGVKGESNWLSGYIVRRWSYDTDSKKELLNRALGQLKRHDDAEITWEAKLNDLEADIGDTIQIADNSKDEPRYFEARVTQVTNHYSVSGEDTGVISNYKRLSSSMASQLVDISNRVKQGIVSVKTFSTDYQISTSASDAPSGEWVKQIPKIPSGMFLWTRNTITYTNGEIQISYGISSTGKNGTNGIDGVGIKEVIIDYAISLTINKTPETWTKELPSAPSGVYLWTRTTIKYTDTKIQDGVSYSYAKQGSDGSSVSVSKVEYSVNQTLLTPPNSGWTESIPTIQNGECLWSKTSFSDGKFVFSVARQGKDPKLTIEKQGKTTTITIENPNGTKQTQQILDGNEGTPGVNGSSSYFHVKYSNDKGQTFTDNQYWNSYKLHKA